jgi:hypothetical protein
VHNLVASERVGCRSMIGDISLIMSVETSYRTAAAASL